MDGNLLENKEGPRECLGTESSVHIDLRALDATNLTGTHTFEVRVRDFARNDAVERWTVDFASTPPATEIGHEDPYGDDEEPVVDEPPGAEVRQIGVSTHELEGDATTAAPSQARAAQTSPPARCGRDVTSQHPQDTFRIKFNGQGTSNGHRYYSYHLHYQVRQRWAPLVQRTRLAATRILPNGTFHGQLYDDSDSRKPRGDGWMPWYAHFKAIKVKPGSEITFWGRWTFKTPVEIGGGVKQIGSHYDGRCIAWLNT
jgi:hypothetical protein